MTQKWLTMKQSWVLANNLAKQLGSIQVVAEKIGCHYTTIYRWREGGDSLPDARHTLSLMELARKMGYRV